MFALVAALLLVGAVGDICTSYTSSTCQYASASGCVLDSAGVCACSGDIAASCTETPPLDICQAEMAAVESSMQHADCYDLMTTLSQASADTGTGTDGLSGFTDALLGALCGSSCFSRILGPYQTYATCLAANSNTQGADVSASFGFLCTRNPATNQYCLSSLVDAATNTANFLATDYSTTSSASPCYYFSDQLGCCARSLYDYYLDLDQSGSDLNATLFNCGLSNMPACPQPATYRKIIRTQVRVGGADWAWFNQNDANRHEFVRAFRADLATTWGVHGEYISFTSFSQGSVVGNAQIIGSTDTETESAFASIKGTSTFDVTNLQNLLMGTPLAASSPSGATMRSVYISPGESKKSSNVGAIVGGVIGGVAAVIIVVAVVFFVMKRKNATAHVR